MENLKMAMIGGRTSVIGFKAVGVEAYIAALPEDGPAIWEAMPLERYAVVMVTEPVYQYLRKQIPDLSTREGLPVVMVMPAVTGSEGLGGSGIKKRVEKAVGAVMES